MDADRKPPHDLAAERSVLGAILIRPSTLDDLSGALAVDDLFLPSHREIYGAMLRVAGSGRPVDVITLLDELHRSSVRLEGGDEYLLTLSSAVPTAENAPHYARLVRGKAILRRTIAACVDAQTRAYGEADAPDVLSELRAAIAALETSDDGGPVKLGDGLARVHDEIENKRNNPAEWSVMTGIQELDAKIGGFKAGQQIVVAANAGGGKTAFAWTTALRAAMQGVPVLAFSMEMQFQEMAERAISFAAEIPGIKLARGTLNQDDWKRIMGARLESLPVWIDDRKLTASRLCAEARRWRARHARGRLALVVIDYLGLVRHEGRSENRNLEVGAMSRQFKILAGELQCPVILVAQLNRENMRGGVDGKPRMPMLSDLRDSGEIEQNADMVLFPWRERTQLNEDGREVDVSEGPAMIIVAKHRNGPTGKIEGLHWDGRFMAFYGTQAAFTARPETRFADA